MATRSGGLAGERLMRYIGNKTRLLPFILDAIDTLGISPAVAHDAFAGTASVGRSLKARGWRVASSDLMTYSYVFQRAYVVAGRIPAFRKLRAGDATLRRALRSPTLRSRAEERGGTALHAIAEFLEAWLEPDCGFMSSEFSPAAGGRRMFFTEDNAARIDAIRRKLFEWRRDGLIDEDSYFLLLAALIEGADRVANTAGVYAAYMKQWQPNARRQLEISPEMPISGTPKSSAHLADAVAVARDIGRIELLYVDPPYNARQYSGYYHVPEIIARGWFEQRPTPQGVAGLVGIGRQKSAWCSRNTVALALDELLAASGARHVLVSYNSEGLLPGDELTAILASASVNGEVRTFGQEYKRYRADSDRDGRRYSGDRVKEMLHYARLR
ncbi:MAG: DNA adenine methylase [Anaerolineae bacterium]|nr:DNA adenine methylase [Gemmatimonadaceae bacterium]